MIEAQNHPQKNASSSYFNWRMMFKAATVFVGSIGAYALARTSGWFDERRNEEDINSALTSKDSHAVSVGQSMKGLFQACPMAMWRSYGIA